MPDLPPSIYLPIGSVLITAILGIIGIATKMVYSLWLENKALVASATSSAVVVATALTKGAEAHSQSTRVLHEVKDVLKENGRVIARFDALAQRQERARRADQGSS